MWSVSDEFGMLPAFPLGCGSCLRESKRPVMASGMGLQRRRTCSLTRESTLRVCAALIPCPRSTTQGSLLENAELVELAEHHGCAHAFRRSLELVQTKRASARRPRTASRTRMRRAM